MARPAPSRLALSAVVGVVSFGLVLASTGSNAAPTAPIAWHETDLAAKPGDGFRVPALPAQDAWTNGIGPGAQLQVFKGGSSYSCTANWVWVDRVGDLYLGTAGHCLLPDGETTTVGPDGYNASGVLVDVCVANCFVGGTNGGLDAGVDDQGPSVAHWRRLGKVAYAQGAGVGDDFGLVRVPANATALLTAGMPVWGEPLGAVDVPVGGARAVVHGHGTGFGDTVATRSREATFNQPYDNRSWSARFQSAGGDSGAAVGLIDEQGHLFAAGIQTHASFCGDVAGRPELRHCEYCPTITRSLVQVKCGMGASGTSIGRAIAMAKEGNLCVAVVLTDPQNATAAADCFPTAPECQPSTAPWAARPIPECCPAAIASSPEARPRCAPVTKT